MLAFFHIRTVIIQRVYIGLWDDNSPDTEKGKH